MLPAPCSFQSTPNHIVQVSLFSFSLELPINGFHTVLYTKADVLYNVSHPSQMLAVFSSINSTDSGSSSNNNKGRSQSPDVRIQPLLAICMGQSQNIVGEFGGS